MIELFGFPASNYYNKVKLALLEKGIAFREVHTYPSQSEELLAASPMGKVPFIRAGGSTIAESQAIVEYLEDAFPEPPLYPRGALARAKCRELIQLMELYLEWPARRLYPAAFFGGTAGDDTRKEVAGALARGVKAFARAARFAPFVCGAEFTYADCAAVWHLPVVASTTKTMFGEDMLAAVPGVTAYLRDIGARPHARVVNEARKAGMEAFIAYRAQLAAQAQAARAAQAGATAP